MKEKILKNIRTIRKNLGKTQAEMAEEMGKSLTAYGNFERGKTRLKQEDIEKFCKLTGKSPSSVVNGYESVEGEASTLEEYRAREYRYRDLISTANDRIRELENELRAAKEVIESQKHSIGVLEDIRHLLESQLSGK